MEVNKTGEKSPFFESIGKSRIAKKIKEKLTRKKKSKEDEIRNDPKIKWVNNPDLKNDGENTLRTIAYHTAATGNKELAKYIAHTERGKAVSKEEIEAHNEEEKKKTKKLKEQAAQQQFQSLQAQGAPKLPPMLSYPPIDGGTRRRKRKRRRKTKKKKKRRRRTKKKKKKRRRRTKKRRRK